MNKLDLRPAFPPMPDACRDALHSAASSVKEEAPVKRFSFRVVLVAALIILATVAIALAADQLGLSDLFSRQYGAQVPESAQSALSNTEQKAFEVGPLTFTLRETLADGRIAYVTTQAMPTDGGDALIALANDGAEAPIPDSEAARLNLPTGISFSEAARRANVPLYLVSSYYTIDEAAMGEEEMQEILWAADGSALLVDMLITHREAVGEALPGMLTLRVQGMDGDWQSEEVISIPVGGVMAERTYKPQGAAVLQGYTVESVKAEQTCAGVYLTATLIAGEGAAREDVYALYERVAFRDADGAEFPVGISLTGTIRDEGWPVVVMETMVGADGLPEVMGVVDLVGGNFILLK
ncbi:MAG: hypothetical protein LBN04_04270 [Oscillospiraceae bacterium]|jgi:hypothetical protein|nr:hypothetical protein [Oscillospiraceae bacterium]